MAYWLARAMGRADGAHAVAPTQRSWPKDTQRTPRRTSAAFFSAIKRSCSSFRRSMTCFRSSADSWSRADAARAISNNLARFAARSGSRISSGLWSLAAWAASAT